MTAPRVSIVMSVYNGAAHLPAALDSILAQTWTDFELIIVDDGSTDQSSEILKKYSQRDPRIRVISQANTGLTLALIRGCQESRGEFMARHDADDWSEPTRLAAQVEILDQQPQIGFVSCATQYVGPQGEPLEIVTRCDDPAVATRKLLDERQGPPAHGSVMFRRALYESVGGYRPEFYFGQDSDLWMRMAERAPIAYVPTCLYSARRDPNSVSGRMSELQHTFGELGQQCRAARRAGESETKHLFAAEKLCKTIPQARHGSSTGRSTMAYLIGTTLKQQGDRRARGYFWQAITLNPWNWRAWCRLLTVW
jgi:glycosyltransferase involved in cell wall biosynthesis